MAITINGSGTITGVSAGGLPDGCVDNDTLSSTLDLSSKTLTIPTDTTGLPAGTVVKVTNMDYTSRQTLPGAGKGVIATMGTFTKDSSTSSIYVIGGIQGHWGPCSEVGVYCSIDDSDPANDDDSFKGSYMFHAHDGDYSTYNTPYLKPIQIHNRFTGLSTGSHTVRIGWRHGTLASTRPFGVVNPTRQSDLSGIQTPATRITVFEVED